MALDYRPDIDGLRAVAVLAVVLFHAELELFSGGYVGVDIFFVISGFLITSIIADRIARGDFSVVAFYAGRVRRIFPALFALIAAASVAAFVLLPPTDFKDFGQGVFAASLFGSNVFFWIKADYFDGPAYMKPLLHTWSLSVEEQFYIVFPILLLALYRCKNIAHPRHLVLALLIVSFAASVYVTAREPVTAFYWTPLRAWELLLGSILALNGLPEIRRQWVAEAAAAAGLALIAWAVFGFSRHTNFPGVNAFIPCFGAALLIQVGRSRSTALSRILSSRPIVLVGLFSYSLYLWHWPMLVFARYWNVLPLSGLQTVVVLALTVLISAASWQFIELPFRRREIMSYQPALFRAGAGASILAAAFGLAVHLSDGWPSRVPDNVRLLDEARNDKNPDRDRCHGDDLNPIAFEDKCVYGAKNAAPSIAIWGDSFAAELAVALGREAGLHNRALLYISYSACPPGVFAAARPRCGEHNRQILSKLREHPTVEKIILVARYSYFLQGEKSSFLSGFEAVATALAQSGKDVIVTYPIPEPPGFVPAMLARFAIAGRNPGDAFIERSRYQRENADIIALLDRIVRRPRITPARIQDLLCGPERCEVFANGRSLYFDNNHLSVYGATFVLPAFAAAFSDGGNGIAPAAGNGARHPVMVK